MPYAVMTELTGGLVRIIRRVEIYESDGETKWDIPYWDRRLSQGQPWPDVIEYDAT